MDKLGGGGGGGGVGRSLCVKKNVKYQRVTDGPQRTRLGLSDNARTVSEMG